MRPFVIAGMSIMFLVGGVGGTPLTQVQAGSPSAPPIFPPQRVFVLPDRALDGPPIMQVLPPSDVVPAGVPSREIIHAYWYQARNGIHHINYAVIEYASAAAALTAKRHYEQGSQALALRHPLAGGESLAVRNGLLTDEVAFRNLLITTNYYVDRSRVLPQAITRVRGIEAQLISRARSYVASAHA